MRTSLNIRTQNMRFLSQRVLLMYPPGSLESEGTSNYEWTFMNSHRLCMFKRLDELHGIQVCLCSNKLSSHSYTVYSFCLTPWSCLLASVLRGTQGQCYSATNSPKASDVKGHSDRPFPHITYLEANLLQTILLLLWQYTRAIVKFIPSSPPPTSHM